jgi:hypothetical protein
MRERKGGTGAVTLLNAQLQLGAVGSARRKRCGKGYFFGRGRQSGVPGLTSRSRLGMLRPSGAILVVGPSRWRRSRFVSVCAFRLAWESQSFTYALGRGAFCGCAIFEKLILLADELKGKELS